MTAELTTVDQVRAHLAEAFGAGREFTVLRCTHGWVCRERLDDDEVSRGAGTGRPNYVVDAVTAVVTAHSGLHPETIGRQYDHAVDEGLPTPGYQVYPAQWEVELIRLRDTPGTVEYRVRAHTLGNLAPGAEFTDLLVIDKRVLSYETESQSDHPACDYAAAWAQGRSGDGHWPERGSFRV